MGISLSSVRAAGGFVLGALLAAIYLLASGSSADVGRHPGGGRPFMAIFDPKTPLMEPGRMVASAEEASARSENDVVEPTHLPQGLASDDRQVWIDTGMGDAGLRYGSELVITFREWPAGMDAAASYATQAKEWEAGFTTTLGGKPAWVIPANDRAPGEPETNVIQVTRGGTDITLYGLFSLDELEKVAESLPE